MSSTHLSLHYHVVFSTKSREPLIAREWRESLHAYLGRVAGNVDAIPQIIGGTGDHVHLLLGLRATHSLAEVVRRIKSVSSTWVHEDIKLPAFAWQEG
jgi:REP element-mobilizing transposase RayT